MSDLFIENCLEHLEIDLEHDSGYPDWEDRFDNPDQLAAIETLNNQVVVINASKESSIPGAFYVVVDDNYNWNMSPGQRRLYEILLAMQKGSLYCITTIGQLTKALDLEIVYAAYHRFANLKSINAIKSVVREQ